MVFPLFRFATTSIPKKPPLPVAVEEAPQEPEQADAAQEVAAVGPVQPALDEATLALQRLVDKCQDKTEKEILRTLKVRLCAP